ncbi:hypothetical protein BTJ40_07010 [Microbulbifer sp. A4B17]|nr:hypothetical protein BTJ40_07010 [Microbulbifer sp. A4B17]
MDFRKQVNGIVLLVSETLHKDPISSQLFVFSNKELD